MSEWQPIETAPKDGTRFLAFDADDGSGIFAGVVCCQWFEPDEDQIEDGWDADWLVTEIGSGDELYGSNLTHWMPLPQPPTQRAQS